MKKKKKKPVTSIFSFSHDVFCPIKEKLHFVLATSKLSSANAFNLDKAKNSLSGKGLRFFHALGRD